MFSIGETRKNLFILLLVFGPIVFGKELIQAMFVYRYKTQYLFTNLLDFCGYSTKLFSGIFECVLRKAFKYTTKEPSPLFFKDYCVYTLIIILEGISLFCSMSYSTITVTFTNIYMVSLLSGFQIYIISLLAFFVLKYKFGKHNLTGLIIILIGLLFSIPIYIFEIKQNFIENEHYKTESDIIKDLILYFIYHISILIIGGVVEVLEKYLLLVKNQSPYKLLFIVGLSQCILSIFFIVKDYYDYSKFDTPEPFDKTSLICLIFGVIFQGVYYYMRLVINYKFTPAHRSISDSLSAIFMFGLSFYFDVGNGKILSGLVGYIICVFGNLVYNEIVIIDIFNINRDTIDQINKRALLEEKEDIIILEDKEEELYESTTDISNIN